MSNSEYILKSYTELGLNQQASICLGFGGFSSLKYWVFICCSPVIRLLTSVLFKIFPTKPTLSCVSFPSVLWWEWSCCCCLEPFDLSESSFCHKNGIFFSDTFMQTDHSLNPYSISYFFWKTTARDTFILESNLYFYTHLILFSVALLLLWWSIHKVLKNVRICYVCIFLMFEEIFKSTRSARLHGNYCIWFALVQWWPFYDSHFYEVCRMSMW